EQWGQLLTEQEEFVWRKERAVEQTMDQYMEQTKALTEQRERHMRSLHREVKRLAVRYRVMKKMRQHRTVIAVAAAVLMLLALPLHGLKSSVSTVTHVDQYVQTYEPAAVSFVNASNRSRYRVEAAQGKASSGYIWLKDDWSEAFLWLENLQ